LNAARRSATSLRGLGPAGSHTRSLKFGCYTSFHVELRRRVAAQLNSTGRRERDCPEMYRKTAIIFASCVADYLLLVFAADAWWQAGPLAIVLALSIVG